MKAGRFERRADAVDVGASCGKVASTLTPPVKSMAKLSPRVKNDTKRADHQHGGQRVPHLACGHEREVGLLVEKFHVRASYRQPIDSLVILRLPPNMSVSSARCP